MIKQLLFSGLLTDFSGRLTQRWRRLWSWRGAGTFTLGGPASKDRPYDARASQYRLEVDLPPCDEAAYAGPLGRSTDAPLGKEEGAVEPRNATGDGGGYCFVSVPDSEEISLFSATTADGSRAVVLFDDQLTAEAFVYIEELGEGWEIIEHPPSQTAVLLEACILANVGYVALNPPSQAVTARWNLRLVPIDNFVVSLLNAEEEA